MKRSVSFALALLLATALAVPALALDFTDGGTRYNDDTVAVIKLDTGEILEYSSLQAAAADAYPGDTINIVKNYTIEQNITVPAYVTLTVPTNADLNDTETGAGVSGDVSRGQAYVTLTVPQGLALNVEGTLLVAGNQQGDVPRTGFLAGDYGALVLDGDITVSGKLYARGEISGSGTVTAVNGGSVYQRFEIADWRGGTASLASYRNYKVFPFNLYTFSGISAKEIYESGSSLYGQAFIVATIFGTERQLNVEVPYISTSSEAGYMIETSDTGTIEFTEEDSAGNTEMIINGTDITTGVLSFDYDFVSITSRDLIGPFGYKMDVVIDNGGRLGVTTGLKFLPGCSFAVRNGTMDIQEGGLCCFYAEDTYQSTFTLNPPAGFDYAAAAVLTVEEGGNVTGPGVLASSSNAFTNISGLGALTYSGTTVVPEVSQTGTAVTLHEITFYNAEISAPAA